LRDEIESRGQLRSWWWNENRKEKCVVNKLEITASC